MQPLEILEITNSLEKLEFVVPLKKDTKKTPFCMSDNKLFFNYGIQDNNWVGHSVIKPVDAVIFQKRKALRKGGNEKETTLKWRFLMKVR